MFEKILYLLRNKAGVVHWWGTKLTSLVLIPLVIYLLLDLAFSMGQQEVSTVILFTHYLFNHNGILLFILNVILLWHIRSGMEIVIEDYVHDEKVRIACIFIIRVLAIEIMKFLYICSMMF